jgi:glycosyltransferase involved in cell wall biosynthesis
MKIGIVVNTFNNETTILRTLESIFFQNTNFFFETKVVIIDDKSTDKTVRKIKFSKFYNKINILHINKKNQGISNSRNKGIMFCTDTDYIFFVDGDDEINKTFLRKINFVKNNSKDLLIFEYKKKYKKQEILKSFFSNTRDLDKAKIKNYFKKYFIAPNKHELFSMCWSKIYKTKFLLKKKLFFNKNLSICEDSEFILRLLLENPKIRYINKLMYIHYLYYSKKTNKLSLASNKNIIHQLSFLHIIKHLKKYLINEGNFQNFKIGFYNCIAVYTKIYLIRSCLSIRSLKSFSEVYYFWKIFCKRKRIKLALQTHYFQKTKESQILTFLLNKGLFLFATLFSFFKSRLRYR